MQSAYPAEFDRPCICDRCGQNVESEPGCTCPPAPTLQDHISKLATDLKAQIQTVRAARYTLTDKREYAKAQRAAFEESHKHELEALQNLDDGCVGAGKILAEEESRLRSLTLQAYHETGEKKPAEGVGIRVTKSLQYDENSIKQWAINEGHIMFLSLDRAGFEGWAKAMMKSSKLPDSLHESGAAVVETTSPQATIAKEL